MDSLDSLLIAPLRPYLSLITRNLPAPLDNLAASLLGPACHASLVQSLDFTTANRACVSLAISKALGIAIVAASAIVKVPQLLKLLNSRSAAGLSFLAVLLETISLVISLAYNARSGFPFSTYGESAFIAIQNVALAALILNFSGRRSMLIFFLTNLAAGLYALFAKNYVSMSVLSYLQASAGLLAVASKVPQIWTVHQEGSTGQLSAFAVFNYLAGSLSRIFTTLQEVDDPLILWGFVAGFALNAVLAAQMVYYWNAPASGKSPYPSAAGTQDLPATEFTSKGRLDGGAGVRKRA